MEYGDRARKMKDVTVLGLVMNAVLTAAKIIAGVWGRSSAMIADGVHSLSDLLSDIIVLIFVGVSSKDSDESHDYGHGKFETLCTIIISMALIAVSVEIALKAVRSAIGIFGGSIPEKPGMIALVAAAISIISKEFLFRVTRKVGREVESGIMVANAWHHRSDALSSVGALIGIGGAMFMGSKWAVLDPLAGCGIAVVILVVAVKMMIPSVEEMLEVSLPKETKEQIVASALSVKGVEDIHALKTRQNGGRVIIDAHIAVAPTLTILQAHSISTEVEHKMKELLGSRTLTYIHVEPGTDSE
ncbi:MAG: cation diffusion facilitator family transporter [Bacteroidales bacterium]|nr:cation diffusion facilitator family transporter [Bacteroidales bacterium]